MNQTNVQVNENHSSTNFKAVTAGRDGITFCFGKTKKSNVCLIPHIY